VHPAPPLEHQPLTIVENAANHYPQNRDFGTRRRTPIATPTVVACTLTAFVVIAALLLMKI
jgi:hypothetical protein